MARVKEAPPVIEEEAPPPPLDELRQDQPDDPQGMDSAPKDGRWIEVLDGGTWRKARWYVTRVRVAGSVAWVKADCWSTSEPPKLAHRVEKPKAWRYPVD